ncbi:hypothetical protein C0995_008367 [Termitomyces sp. Mi166|nr:hypothetical protein C0995_008367 [Termitomyces sp. Mi166\
MAMTTNCLTSSLIVSRIWNVRRESSRYRTFLVQQQDPLSRAIRITIEAGLIYTISLIVLLIIYLTHHNSQFGVQRVTPMVITKDVVVSRDPPVPEDPVTNSERAGKTEDGGKIEEQRTSGSW